MNAKPLEKNICRNTTKSLNSVKIYDKNNEDEKTTAMALLLKEPTKRRKKRKQPEMK